jgi:hypothetical protein
MASLLPRRPGMWFPQHLPIFSRRRRSGSPAHLPNDATCPIEHLMYEPGRYSPGKLSNVYGQEVWLVYDGATNPDTPLKDWRRKNRVNWKGTEEEAEELCALLNRTGRLLGNVRPVAEADMMSKSQEIMWANVARKKSTKRSTPSSSPGSALRGQQSAVKSTFVKCSKCKRMVKEDHDCQA